MRPVRKRIRRRRKRRGEEEKEEALLSDDYQAPSSQIHCLGRKWLWTDGPTDGPTDGRTKPLIEMRGRI